MADLTVTAANVVNTSAVTTQGVAGGTITAGQAVYKRASDGKWLAAQCDGTAEEAGSVDVGIALHAALANQPVVVALDGAINIGATTSKATLYVVGAAAGGVAPIADLTSGQRITHLGYATATDGTLVIHRRATGATI
jgi:hypothetical protein